MKDKQLPLLLLAVMAGVQYFCYWQDPFTVWELPFSTDLTAADTASGNLLMIMYAYLPVPFFLIVFSGDMRQLFAGYGLLLAVRGQNRYRILLKTEGKMILGVFVSVFLAGGVYGLWKKDVWEDLTTEQTLWALCLYALALCALIQLQYVLELYTDVQYALGITLMTGVLSLFISGSSRQQSLINLILFLNLGFARKNGVIATDQTILTPLASLAWLAAVCVILAGITLKVFGKKDMI